MCYVKFIFSLLRFIGSVLLLLTRTSSRFCLDVFVSRCFDQAVEQWRQFHCDMNDLSQWLSDTEQVLADGMGPNGELHAHCTRAQQQVRHRVRGHRPTEGYHGLLYNLLCYLFVFHSPALVILFIYTSMSTALCD